VRAALVRPRAVIQGCAVAVDLQFDAGVMVVTINRPEAMNALDPDANAALADAWERYMQDDSLQAAVITGAGDKAFCAGADLKKSIPARRAAVRAGQAVPWAFAGGLTADRDLGKPLIAAVNGHCLAGGLELALACDLRICTPNATFGLSEVKWAIIPGGGGTQRLPRCVPVGLAMEMILTGEAIDAGAAAAAGLVNRIVPQGELLASALAIARRIVANGPLAVRAARRAVRAGLEQGFAHGMALEKELLDEVMRSDDAAEGPRAFAERRRPSYQGR
jgi:enoyl-CoA hydratase/carnithine racemase